MRFVTKWYKTVAIAFAAIVLPGAVEANCCEQSVNNIKEKISNDTDDFTTDGPYVFYKKKMVIVRSVYRKSNGLLVAKKEIYNSKKDVPFLICKVDDESKASFKIKLHSDYAVPPSVYPESKKIFAIADIEGNFNAFATTLQGNGIINKNFKWTYGDGHLVLVGDFFDRGNNVTEVLWLIYELERQAAHKGGMVHFIIGNHEAMNFRGDDRYVKAKYFKVASAFKTKYISLYASNTELGKWLRSKNVIEKIGKTLFTHGGLSPQLAELHLQLEEINKIARENYGKPVWKIEQNGGTAKSIYSMIGPMWYRGYFSGNLQTQEVKAVLNLYSAKAVVVGHTVVPNVSNIFENKVFAIDVKHCTALENGTSNALLIENNEYYAVNARGYRSTVYPMLTKNEVLKVFTAIRENNMEDVKQFLINGNSINKYYSSKQYTLLHYAIKNNQPLVVELLLENGANIEQTFETQTPLMYAIKMQHLEIAFILIHHGANVNTLNVSQETALFYCAKYGDLEILKFLIANGANLQIKNAKGRTAIDYALKHDNKAIAKYLKSL